MNQIFARRMLLRKIEKEREKEREALGENTNFWKNYHDLVVSTRNKVEKQFN